MREHIRQRGKTWTYVVDVGRREDGRRRQATKGGFKTQRAARAAARQLLVSNEESGTYTPPAKERFGPFLERWLDSVRATVRPSTHAMYETLVEKQIVPAIGNVELRRLTASRLNVLYADLLEHGRRDGKGGLSPETVRKVHVTIRKALKAAVKWGDLRRNVADDADPPPKGQAGAKLRTCTAGELADFLDYIRGDRLYPAYLLLATTGLRRGELLGLRWGDLDLEAARLSLVQTVITVNYEVTFSTPKTARGRRAVALDASTVAALREHRTRQVGERTALGLPWPSRSDLAFAQPDRAPIHPNGFSDRFDKLVARSGLPRVTVHDLRHTHATLALQAGVNPKVVSERLGHSSVALTLDIYSHVSAVLEEEAAERVAALVFQAGR